jgi:hypothetical protein
MSEETALAYHPWSTYLAAREEARRLGDKRIGTEHLLLGLLRDPVIEGAVGVSLQNARDALTSLDDAALHAIGFKNIPSTPPIAEKAIPRRPTARQVMGNRLKMTPTAKTAIKEASRPMRRGRQISPTRVLRALLEYQRPDPASVLLKALGVDQVKLRLKLETGEFEK